MAEVENSAPAVVAESEPTAGVTTIAVEETTTPQTTEVATTEEVTKSAPAEDPIGWLTVLGRNAVHKVSYQVKKNRLLIPIDKYYLLIISCCLLGVCPSLLRPSWSEHRVRKRPRPMPCLLKR